MDLPEDKLNLDVGLSIHQDSSDLVKEIKIKMTNLIFKKKN
ncbi:hypothetical protein [Lactobacillus hominis]|uniref:Uncharacterized protein n=1 Tax=Lactobacillus hominis DSM 23910 = CRBIP 24.179 TaxID=1423758 RepID=I7L901_9LACO|nr:hypothetical protein [Lactobacillus hominis]CCI81064.1 Protein of unknown function [Lactobacillus hominis DSM 23910 = CRBIP 24.179]